jgi:hypothetical protein
MTARNIKDINFDFEGAYISKSPCRDCARENSLPDCSTNCRLLSQVQALLTGTRSYSNKFSESETYSLPIRDF